MTEREKLIELLGTASSIAFPRENNDFIADFLLAHGVVVLPCKVGDTVYIIHPSNPLHIWELKVTGYHYSEYGKQKGLYICCGSNWGTALFNCSKIGKTVFLTREQAEQALRERENKIPIRAHKILKFRRKSKFILEHDRYNGFVTMELCKTCKKSFENWVNRKPYNDFVEERENNG